MAGLIDFAKAAGGGARYYLENPFRNLAGLSQQLPFVARTSVYLLAGYYSNYSLLGTVTLTTATLVYTHIMISRAIEGTNRGDSPVIRDRQVASPGVGWKGQVKNFLNDPPSEGDKKLLDSSQFNSISQGGRPGESELQTVIRYCMSSDKGKEELLVLINATLKKHLHVENAKPEFFSTELLESADIKKLGKKDENKEDVRSFFIELVSIAKSVSAELQSKPAEPPNAPSPKGLG